MTGQGISSISGVAKVTFRVRCETLGYGESVFLYPNNQTTRPIPLYTTTSNYPWFEARSPTAISIPVGHKVNTSSEFDFSYRYGIHRAGVFHRWEGLSDGPSNADTEMVNSDQESKQESVDSHVLPLRLLAVGEEYTVNDVLGVTTGHPNIDHIRVPHSSLYGEMTSLHSNSRNSGISLNSSRRNLSMETADTTGKKKKVGFAPEPPAYHATSGSKASMKKTSVHLDSTDGLIVASAFLPVHLHRSEDGKWSADWDYEALLSMQTHLRVTRIGVVKWRGWHGNVGKDGSPEQGVPMEERPKVEACLRAFNCVPVWVEPGLFGEMYNGFCKGVLWPVLHNVTSVYSTRPDGGGGISKGGAEDVNSKFQSPTPGSPDSMGVAETLNSVSNRFTEYSNDAVSMGTIHGDGGKEASLWAAYTAVNRKFAETIVQCFNEGDLVWIHGFHLLILPSFLTRRLPMAKVGIFLHTPFPSSEIFRTLWCREDILRGMLNADQVGFHLFEYARHFLTCSRRLLGLKYGMVPDESGGHNLAIETNGRHVAVTSIHAGIEPPILSQVLTHPSTVERATSIRKQFEGKIIFCAIDRMESLKGIPLKMLGLERFLNKCPEWIGKMVLVQVGISAFERADDYVRTKHEILSIVSRINKTWPGTIQFQECSEAEMRLPQRMALMRAADVVMVTPIRDGLNLIPLEFTVTHQDALTKEGKADGRKRGLCILSEFSSSTRVMRGAIHVNPWKISELANAFHTALNISEDERIRRLRTASEFVTRVTTQRWAMAVLLDLKAVHKNADVQKYSGAGLGLGYRILGMDRDFNSLDIGAVSKAYKKARSRLIFMDYGGTIVSNDNLDNLSRFQVATKSRKYSVPTPEMIGTLKELCADKRNIVFVVSGKERHSLSETLGNIDNLGLVAEHGFFVSWPTSNTAIKRLWETLVPDQDKSWRNIAITIMEVYTSRTHGSYIEETEMKVLWQYRDADPEFGYLQARELEDHLSNVLRSYAVDILHGGVEEGGFVEVRPKGVNKGVVSTHILKNVKKISTRDKVDFILALGDDHCDEPMLSVMRQVGRRAVDAKRARNHEASLPPMPASVTLVDVSSCDPYVSSNLTTFTCTVGKKPSAAANYLHDVEEVQEFLDTLVKMSTRDHQFYSSIDLRGLDSGVNANRMPTVQSSVFGKTMNFDQQNNMFRNQQTISSGVTRSMSMGNFHMSDFKRNDAKVSSNLSEFLTPLEDEEDEDAVFF